MGEQTKACHVQIHNTKAEIDAAEIRLYERDVFERDRDITGFDQRRAMLGELLGSQPFYEQELEGWKSHPVQFESEHSSLWRVIAGEVLFDKKHPFDVSIPAVPGNWSHPGNPVPGGSDPKTVGKPGDGDPAFQVQTASVPEPTSAVLGFTALIVGLVAMIGRRRLKTSRGA